MDKLIIPSLYTCAKSRTRFNKRLAIRGVPRDRDASSSAASSAMDIFNSLADRLTMRTRSSAVYGSSLQITPNLSRNGPVSMPARVVAPISVNLFRFSRNDVAPAPLPVEMSSAKSSIAGYSTSSIEWLSLWISSRNSTSRSCMFVNSEARFAARSIPGPLVTLISTPSSEAIICASVVLPSPGGPYSKTWSSASPRALLAATYTLRLAFTLS